MRKGESKRWASEELDRYINTTTGAIHIRSLATYGKKAISVITEIINSSIDDQVRTHGYKTIQTFKTLP